MRPINWNFGMYKLFHIVRIHAVFAGFVILIVTLGVTSTTDYIEDDELDSCSNEGDDCTSLSEEYRNNGHDLEYYDYDDDEREIENSLDLELEEPDVTYNDTSRFFRLRQKRRRGRRRRKPRRGGRRRRPRRPRGRRVPSRQRPPPGGRNNKPTNVIEEKSKHGDLILRGTPVGPFYAESSHSHIPLPDTPVLLAIYPEKRKKSNGKSGTGERKLEFKNQKEPILQSTTTKPKAVETPTRHLQQTFNIAIPTQPQPIVINSPSNTINKPKSSTQTSHVAVRLGSSQYPATSSASQSVPQSAYGSPYPYQTYMSPNQNNINNCATTSKSSDWAPFFQNNLQNDVGPGRSHYFGRRIDTPQIKQNCQYQNSNTGPFNIPWSQNNQQQSFTTNTNNNNIASTITRYFPSSLSSQPITTSTFQFTPSQAYEVSQNIYESFKSRQPQLQHLQQQQLFPQSPIITIQHQLQPPPSTATNLNQNQNYNSFPVNNNNNNQNVGNQLSDYDFAPAKPLSTKLKAPKESYNYLTYKNNQLSAEDYEFPISNEQVDEYNLPPVKKQKGGSYGNVPSFGEHRPIKKKKKKKKIVKIKTLSDLKKQKEEKLKQEVDFFKSVKHEIESVPTRVLGKLFPKLHVSETSAGGTNVEFTIGK